MYENAPNAVDIFPNLVRVCPLELGELRRAFDLEEDFVSCRRDDLSFTCSARQPLDYSDIRVP